jgi:hypothetical protein
MTTHTLESLSKLFSEHDVVTITFTKKDGTERILKGTRKLIPDEHKPKSDQKESKSSSSFVVFDVDANGWRSLSPSSIISVVV